MVRLPYLRGIATLTAGPPFGSSSSLIELVSKHKGFYGALAIEPVLSRFRILPYLGF